MNEMGVEGAGSGPIRRHTSETFGCDTEGLCDMRYSSAFNSLQRANPQTPRYTFARGRA